MPALLARNRNYRLLFSASSVSNLGDGVSALALPWLATLLTRDAVSIALVAMAGRLPWFLFSLPAGVWTDRADRRLLMVRADAVRMVLTLGIVALALSVPASPPPGGAASMILVLAGLAFLLGTAEVLRDNAAQTVLPSIVAMDDLEAANGQMWSAEQVMGQFVGPPLAGVLIGLGIAVPFGFDAATFAIAAALVWLLALPPRAATGSPRFWPALVDGFRWIRSHPLILRLAVVLGLVNFCATAGLTVLVLYAQEVLGLSAFGYGLLLTSAAAGAVIGGLAAPVIARRIGMRASLLSGLGTFSMSYFLLAVAVSPMLAGAALFVEAAGAMLWNVVTVSYRQRTIPDDILGRVNAIYRFLGWGMMPLGALAGGAIVSLAEPAFGRLAALHLPYVLAGCGVALLFVYVAGRMRAG
jgi:MFS family permease